MPHQSARTPLSPVAEAADELDLLAAGQIVREAEGDVTNAVVVDGIVEGLLALSPVDLRRGESLVLPRTSPAASVENGQQGVRAAVRGAQSACGRKGCTYEAMAERFEIARTEPSKIDVTRSAGRLQHHPREGSSAAGSQERCRALVAAFKRITLSV